MSGPPKQFLCSHLVTVEWHGKSAGANLEKIWSSGATLDIEESLDPGTEIVILDDDLKFPARVARNYEDLAGTLIDVEFTGGFRWTPERFRPDHLTDPDVLLVKKVIGELS